MTKAAAKLEWINNAISSGRTVYVCTMTRSTKVRAKDVAKFDAIGRPLFKISGESLYMSFGKRYDCIDGCKLIAE